MTATAELIEKYRKLAGREIHVGIWLQIDQQRINGFARVTGDQQWIHIGPQRAAKESPYGTTNAHGFLTLSLLSYLSQSNPPDFFSRNYPGMRLQVNYGFNKLRSRNRSCASTGFVLGRLYNQLKRSTGSADCV